MLTTMKHDRILLVWCDRALGSRSEVFVFEYQCMELGGISIVDLRLLFKL